MDPFYFLVVLSFCGLGHTTYVKVFNHNTAGGFFAATNSPDDVLSKNPTDPNADLYSILDTLENYRDAEGKFTFKICYPEYTGVGGGRCNEWKQTSNFATETTITGFEPIGTLAWNLRGDGQPWGGLGKNIASQQTRTLIDDMPNSSTFWNSIGAFVLYSTSGTAPNIIKRILGPRSSVGSRQVTKVEIFVRDAKCLDGWTYNPNTFKCYKFIQKKGTWSEARRDCLSKVISPNPPKLPITRVNLVSIKDDEENHFVDSLLVPSHCQGAWIGGHLLGDGSWLWTDGSKWTYDNWKCGQNVREDSLFLKANGDWNVGRFSDILCGYVCQYLDLNQFTD